jgi:dTDP-4-amino-4,6-dideoxygalactose transaminase
MSQFKRRDDLLLFGRPQIHEDDIREVLDTLKSGWIGTGPKVEEFENRFKKYLGSRYAIALESGSAALFLAMVTAGIGPGDEVITTPMTFCATANAIIHTGAVPVFVDISQDTCTIDPEKLEAAVTPKTKAIIPVHLYGTPCEMDEILRISRKHNLIVIEDAAHCIEGWYKKQKVGNIGDMTCFSFHANKNLTTAKGGLVTTNRKVWAKKLKLFRDRGIDQNVWEIFSKTPLETSNVAVPGYNYCMTDIQAALGIHQINKLDDQLQEREKIWKKYDKAFSELPVRIAPQPAISIIHARHLCTFWIEKHNCGITRDEFRKKLFELNIGTGIHYISLHLQTFYQQRFKFKPEDYPIAKTVSEKTVSLPVYTGLSEADVEYITDAVKMVITTAKF